MAPSAPARPALALGVIADDFTGATDIASMLVRGGLRTVQVIGVPQGPPPLDADAVVVALKTRTVPAAQAVAESLAAWEWLRRAGAQRAFFKYCSTFDSTAEGNIGPVAEALMLALNTDFSIACPAFPENGRTVFRGHLFVGDELLQDSGMRLHPLTPMHDSNLVRVLQAQCKTAAGVSRQPGQASPSSASVGLLRYDDIAQGVDAVRKRIQALRSSGVRIAVADALHNDDLRTLARACSDLPLLTGGSGLALGLPELLAEQGAVELNLQAGAWPPTQTPAAVLAGSCSTATLGQVAHWRAAGRPAFQIDARALARGEPVAQQALAWARSMATGASGPSIAPLFHASVPAAELQTLQTEWGAQALGSAVEACLAQIARGLMDSGTQRLVVAGGETSGAVVQALAVPALRIGAAICPGVPWTQALASPWWLALKSGNFGAPDFFSAALGEAP